MRYSQEKLDLLPLFKEKLKETMLNIVNWWKQMLPLVVLAKASNKLRQSKRI